MTIQVSVALPFITGVYIEPPRHEKDALAVFFKTRGLFTVDIDTVNYNPHTLYLSTPIRLNLVIPNMAAGTTKNIDWSFIEGRSASIPYPYVLKGCTSLREIHTDKDGSSAVFLVEFTRLESILPRERAKEVVRDFLANGVPEVIDDALLSNLIDLGIAHCDSYNLSPEERAKLFQ